MNVTWRHFRGAWVTWEELFAQAASFATSLGRKRTISVSHSEDKTDGVVTVWYGQVAGKADPPAASRGPKLNFRLWRGTWATWEELFREAAEFASAVGAPNVLNISHSEDKPKGVVVVWYWE